VRIDGHAIETEAESVRARAVRLIAILDPGRAGDKERAEIIALVRERTKAKKPLPDFQV
jgi:hypothetical protein